MQKIRIGIDLDHVIRDINTQIVTYYQKDYDESIDLDEVDYLDDVIRTVCHFNTRAEEIRFMYEDYPLEIFGHANQMDRFLSRDLNLWMNNLLNQEDYEVEIFFYSMNEKDLTIQSSYFFLSKIGSRVRKVVFPRTIDELSEYGDIFITAYPLNAKNLKKMDKKIIYIKTHCNSNGNEYADLRYDSFREFMNDDNKLNKIVKVLGICKKENKEKSLWTSMLSWISSLLPMKRD